MYRIGLFSKINKVTVKTLRYYDGDIIGLYQRNPKTKGFTGIVLFFALKRESIVRREAIQHHF